MKPKLASSRHLGIIKNYVIFRYHPIINHVMKDFIFLFTPWWGKIIGIPLGFLVAGPAGAVFGILLGNIFDIGLYHALHTPHWHYYRQATLAVKKDFLPALFQVMGHIAKTDGHITENDIAIARSIIKEIRLFGTNKRLAMKYYNDGKQPGFKFEDKLRSIKHLCYYQPHLLTLFTQTQYRAAQVNVVSEAKKDKLNILYNLLGFESIYPERATPYTQQKERTQKQYSHHYQKTQTPPPYSENRPRTDYAVLGVAEGERAEIVKKAYRKLMSKNHPDKLIAQKASKQAIEQATHKAQLIRAAYERIKKSRGF